MHKEITVFYRGWLLFAPIYVNQIDEEDQEIFAYPYLTWLLNLAIFVQQLINVGIYMVSPYNVYFNIRLKRLKEPKIIEVDV